jgi:poly(hydroxyalkanoate) granule-associated protein
MVSKLHKKSAAAAEAAKTAMAGSAKQFWSAGMDALTRAQSEGSKAVESLVKESLSIQRKTTAAAEEKISEATHKMSSLATDIGSKANGQWDKLENIFEERVAKALNKLGVPSAKDVNALIARIDALNKTVQKMSEQMPATASKAAKTPAPKKAPAKAATPSRKPATPAKAAAPKG